RFARGMKRAWVELFPTASQNVAVKRFLGLPSSLAHSAPHRTSGNVSFRPASGRLCHAAWFAVKITPDTEYGDENRFDGRLLPFEKFTRRVPVGRSVPDAARRGAGRIRRALRLARSAALPGCRREAMGGGGREHSACR